MQLFWDVVHITDLHISEQDSASECLRAGYYQEYCIGLARHIEKCSERVAAIIVTGDFVHQGELQGLDHALDVVKFLARQLGVAPEHVVLCIGNHDTVVDLDRNGKYLEARNDFFERFVLFSDSSTVCKSENGRGALLRLHSDIYCLSLDSTLGCEGSGGPGKISQDEIDEIMGWLRNEVPLQKGLLIVATHHPVHSDTAFLGPFDDDDPDWNTRHIWSSAQPLFQRISEFRGDAPNLWLSGDIHKHYCKFNGNVLTVCTGRFGTSTAKHSQVRRQARLLRVPVDGDVTSWLFEYEPEGHVDRTLGRWVLKQSVIHRPVRRDTLPVTLEVAENNHSGNIQQAVEQSFAPDKLRCTPTVHLLDPLLQDEIMDAVRKSGLYHFGRFTTAEGIASLSWISIGPLMNYAAIFDSVVTVMASTMREAVLGEADSQRSTAFVGLDCWGAVLASQLSVITDAPNICVAARARGSYAVSSEKITSTSLRRINIDSCRNIVIVSDVVATGLSLKFVYDEIKAKVGSPDVFERLKWYALSIVCDGGQDRGETVQFLEKHWTACRDLRMPMLGEGLLPDEAILPARLAFREQESR